MYKKGVLEPFDTPNRKKKDQANKSESFFERCSRIQKEKAEAARKPSLK